MRESHNDPPCSRSVRFMSAVIRWYQTVRAGRPSPCRFTPTCSSYALEALATHGSVRGTWLAARRLLRCRPFGASGWDPVPPARTSLPADRPFAP